MEVTLPVDHAQLGHEMFSRLNESQKAAAEAIFDAIENDSEERLFFVDGPGGTGKTYLYKFLYHMMRTRDLQVISVAWTEIATNL